MSDRPVVVVPTRNAAEGFAALLALDPGMDAAANVGPMTEAGRAIQSVVVTEAVRDATIGGKKVKKGQTIALDPDDGLVAADNDTAKAVIKAMTALTPGFELVTALTSPRRSRWRSGSEAWRRVPRSRSGTVASPSTGI